MDSDHPMRSGQKSEVEQLFAEPHAANILLQLLYENGQTRDELEDDVCKDEHPEGEPPKKVSLEKALRLLSEIGMVKEESGEVKLTFKGLGVAEIYDRLEDMFPSSALQRRLIVPRRLSSNRMIGYYEQGFLEIMVCTVSPRYGRYVFRGESDSDHHLVPFAYRTESKDGKISGRNKIKMEAEQYLNRQRLIMPGKDLDMGQSFYEIATLLWFYDMANRQGLRVPDIPHTSLGNEFFEAQKQAFQIDGDAFLEDWSEIASVAQHYGVPTRMLDWTFDVNLALYFAVMRLPDDNPDAEHPSAISLWALDKTRITTMDSGVKIVVPKYCDNPNISAQSGLFTLLTGDDPGKDLEKLIEEILVDEKLSSKFIMDHDHEPVLKKIDIPYEEAVKIKKNLEERGTNYHSAFPGWDGIIRSMEIQSGIRKA